MTPGVAIFRCTDCKAALFPRRLLCPHCHGAAFDDERVYDAVVEEVSVVRHMLGQADWQPHRIANVRTAAGVPLTVGLRDESGPGAAVALFEENGAPFGVAKEMKAMKKSP
jgi:uncharacterized OB-fold protein